MKAWSAPKSKYTQEINSKKIYNALQLEIMTNSGTYIQLDIKPNIT